MIAVAARGRNRDKERDRRGDSSMLAFLCLGFLIGLRHALEADHVAAVVSLSTRGGGIARQAAQGALWGLGHTLTLPVVRRGRAGPGRRGR